MTATRNEREAYAELLRAWRIRRQHIEREAERDKKAVHIVLCIWVTVVIVLLAVIFTA